MMSVIEKPIKKYLEHHHGAPHDSSKQYMFYRCELCRGLVSWKQINEGGCGKCLTGSRVRAAHLSTWEKVKALVLPWMI